MKKRNYTIKITAAILSILLVGTVMIATASSIFIKGNGNIVKKERTVKDFNGINVSSAIDLHLTKGSAQKVVVESDENIIEHIITEVNNDGILILKIKGKTNIKNPTKLNVYVTYTSLKSLHASGASSVQSSSTIEAEDFEIDASGAADIDLKIDVNKLEVDISGASDLALKGKTAKMTAEISGASNFIADNLNAEDVNIQLSGASDAKVKAIKSIDASASGASELKYTGSPASKNVNTSGASSIKKF